MAQTNALIRNFVVNLAAKNIIVNSIPPGNYGKERIKPFLILG